MGAGIAQVAARAGHPTQLFDIDSDACARAVARIGDSLGRARQRGKISKEEERATIGRITPCHALEDLSRADVIIEAIVEQLDAKRTLLAELESHTRPSTVYASNTSSISITAMAASLKHPQRLVGMHFFNPATRMPLVEVVSGIQTDPGVAETVFDLASAWGKRPVYAKSTPGFIVNRVARPFYAEGLRALQEQAADVPTLDALMRESGGFRMGPFELTDLIGQDVNYAVTESIYLAFYHDPRFRPSPVQRELVLGGLLGSKSGRGFYRYPKDDTGVAQSLPRTKPPRKLVAHGALGALEPLLTILERESIPIQVDRKDSEEGCEGCVELDQQVLLKLTDGRSATELSATGNRHPVVVVDLALDYEHAPRIALSAATQCSKTQLDKVVGLFQSLKKEVSLLKDFPAMMVMRTVCMLANEAADAVYQGVCSEADVDEAMRYGVNYPLGPLDWARKIGLQHVIRVIQNLSLFYGEERYRVSPWLRHQLYAKQSS